MNAHAVQQCILPHCSKTYDVSTLHSTCDKCGSLVDVRYSGRPPATLKEVFDDRRRQQGNIFDESGVWRFRELINFPGVDCDDYATYSPVLVSLGGAEGRTKPVHLPRVAAYVGVRPERLWLQFEGDNPTGSFKDNGMATAFTHAKMIGVKQIACASTGNTSSSAAAFAAHEGLEALVFMGEGRIALGKLAQALDYGARVLQIRGDFDDAMRRIQEIAARRDLYVVNSLNAFRLEGQKTMMYRALAYLRWQAPDWIVCPGGNLGNAAAFGKALHELAAWGWIQRVPRVAVVNAEGANTLYHLVNEAGVTWNGGHVDDDAIDAYYADLTQQGRKASTQASAIEILRPVNLKKALRTLEYTNGLVTQVSDAALLDARALVSRSGFGCELASAATIAGIKRLVAEERIQPDETVVGILTGHMLKDPDTIVQYHLRREHPFSNPPHVVANDLSAILAHL